MTLLAHEQIIFKMAVLVWKCLYDQTPPYLAAGCIYQWSTSVTLCSSGALLVPWTQTYASAALLCMVQEPGTVCIQHFYCQILLYAR